MSAGQHQGVPVGAEHHGAFLRDVGGRVRVLREAAHVTQRDLAASAGISRTTLNRFEVGLTDLHLSRLFVIAEALGVEPGVFFERD